MKKRLITIALLGVMVLSAAPGVLAVESKQVNSRNVMEAQILDNPQARADVIQYKYQVTADGRLQVRRWNATRGYWVDPYWKDVPKSI